MARLLAAIRQSKRKELSESPATQRRDIEAYAQRTGDALVAEAEDIGVSATISPFDRKSLGPWLTDPKKLAQWDVLAVWKVDRAVRDMTHFYGELVPKIVKDLGKHIVAVTEGIDTRTSSEIEIAMRVSMAQEELKKLKDRARNSRARLRENARWGGGPPYFGYYAVKTPQGYKLAIDEEAQEALLTVRDLLREGYTLNYCTAYLNQEGVMTAWDRHAVRMGRKPKGRKWRRKTLEDMLKAKHLMGYGTYRGEVIRDEEGNPRMFGEPIFDRAEWDEIQTLIAQPTRTRRRRGSSMLRGIAYCNGCGRPMNRHPGGQKDVPRYICSVRAFPGIDDCWASGYPAADLEEIIEDLFLRQYGDEEIVEVEAAALVDHGPRLKEIAEAMDQLETDLYIKGRFKGPEGERRFDRLYAALEAERDELLAAQKAEEGVKYRRTGKTYRALWAELDREARGDMLRKFGVTAMVQWRKIYTPPLDLPPYVRVEFPLLDEARP